MRSEEVTGIGTITCDGYEIPYTVIYSDRSNSWAVDVKTNASVIVSMPQNIPPEKVRKLVETKSEWIDYQVQKYSCLPQISRSYTAAAPLPFLGREYQVIRRTGSPAIVEFTNGQFLITIPAGFTETDQTVIARDLVIMLYRRIGTAPSGRDHTALRLPSQKFSPPKLRILHHNQRLHPPCPKDRCRIHHRPRTCPPSDTAITRKPSGTKSHASYLNTAMQKNPQNRRLEIRILKSTK